jgi:hypothetical protein
MYIVSSHIELLTAIELLSPLRILERDYISKGSVSRDRSDIEEISQK